MTQDFDPQKEIERLSRTIAQQNKRISELEEENEELRNKIGELERIVDPNPGSVEYNQLTKDQKVNRIRCKLVKLAENNAGRAALNYKEVKRLFNMHPSNGHAYTLMEAAGTLPGFTYQEPTESSSGEYRITVKTSSVNDIERFHAANNEKLETPA